MICRDARELLSALIDEQLTDAEEIAVRSHLERCEGCRSFLEELDQTAAAVRALPRVEVSAEFTNRVMARVEQAEERRARWPRWAHWDIAALLPAPMLRMAAVLVLGVFVGLGAANYLRTRSSNAPVVAEETAPAPAESASALSSPAAPGTQHAISAGDEIDYVLDRYTLVPSRGPSAAPGAAAGTRPAVANQDVPVRF